MPRVVLVAPECPSLPAVHVRGREVDQRHQAGLHDHARVKERGPGAREIPPRRGEPLLHGHAEGADTRGGAERQRVDLRGGQEPSRRGGIDRRPAFHRAERRLRRDDLEVIRRVRARGGRVGHQDLTDERKPDRRLPGLPEVDLAAEHRARGVPAADAAGMKLKLEIEALRQVDGRLRRVDARRLGGVRRDGLIQVQMERGGGRRRDDDAVPGRRGDLREIERPARDLEAGVVALERRHPRDDVRRDPGAAGFDAIGLPAGDRAPDRHPQHGGGAAGEEHADQPGRLEQVEPYVEAVVVQEGSVARRRRHPGSPLGHRVAEEGRAKRGLAPEHERRRRRRARMGWPVSSASRLRIRRMKASDSSSRASAPSCGSRFPLIVRSGWSRR